MDNFKSIIARDSSLNASTIDNLLEQVDLLLQENDDECLCVEVDLQKVEFIDPYGLVCLCLIGRQLKKIFRNIHVLLPNNKDMYRYLCAMKFPDCTKDFMSLKDAEYLTAPVQQGESDVLLELTKIEAKDKETKRDITCITNSILEKVGHILQKDLNFSKKEVDNFSTIISELCYNIKDHSEDKGFVSVHRYTRRSDGRKYVVIGVGDLGIGIKNSLNKRFDMSKLSHLEAIGMALKKEFSVLPDRGLGLYMVSKIIKDYKGTLHIRSGDARLYLRNTAHGMQTSLFPGTQVSISLSELQEKT